MAYETVNGKPLTDKGNQEHQQQEFEQQEQVKERAEALAVKLAQTYEELTRLLERNPGVKRQITEGATKEDKVYQKLKQRLKLADMAPRCRWVKQGGTACGSPQMKQHIYCFAHRQMAEAMALALRLPAMEDANAIQVGLMRIQKALIEDTISTKKAGLLLYSMQLGLTNVGQTTFGQAKDEEMVRETVSEEQAVREDIFSAEDSGEGETSPRMNAHGRGSGEEENGARVEYVAMPGGGYRFTGTPLRIDPSNRRPPQSAINPTIAQPRAAVSQEHGLPPEHAETRAILG